MDNQDIKNHSRSCLLTSYHSTWELNSKEGTSFPSSHPLIFPFPPLYTASMCTVQFAEIFSSSPGSHICGWYQHRIKYSRKHQEVCTVCLFRAKHLMVSLGLKHMSRIWTCRFHRQPLHPMQCHCLESRLPYHLLGVFLFLPRQDLLSEEGSSELLSLYQQVVFTLLH